MIAPATLPSDFLLGLLFALAAVIALIAALALVVRLFIAASPEFLLVLLLMALCTLLLICGTLGVLPHPFFP